VPLKRTPYLIVKYAVDASYGKTRRTISHRHHSHHIILLFRQLLQDGHHDRSKVLLLSRRVIVLHSYLNQIAQMPISASLL